jgi:transposase
LPPCSNNRRVVALRPPRQQIHIILDDLSAHKTALLREFLERNPHVRFFHFTPLILHG